MNVARRAFDGLYILNAEMDTDERGSFSRIFETEALEQLGIAIAFPHWSCATNVHAGTIRGMHYAAAPNDEAKLVRVVAGALVDIVVDIRPQSSTFGRWDAIELTASAARTIYVPAGFAHGYQTLVDHTVVVYGISQPYDATAARAIDPLDPGVGIVWPLPVSVISQRDRNSPTLATVSAGAGS